MSDTHKIDPLLESHHLDIQYSHNTLYPINKQSLSNGHLSLICQLLFSTQLGTFPTQYKFPE